MVDDVITAVRLAGGHIAAIGRAGRGIEACVSPAGGGEVLLWPPVLLEDQSRQAATLAAHIDALLDLHHKRSPGSQAWLDPANPSPRAL